MNISWLLGLLIPLGIGLSAGEPSIIIVRVYEFSSSILNALGHLYICLWSGALSATGRGDAGAAADAVALASAHLIYASLSWLTLVSWPAPVEPCESPGEVCSS